MTYSARLPLGRRMLWAMAITGGVLLVELAGGLLSGSLALLSDTGLILRQIEHLLGHRFDIEHSTIQFETLAMHREHVDGTPQSSHSNSDL